MGTSISVQGGGGYRQLAQARALTRFVPLCKLLCCCILLQRASMLVPRPPDLRQLALVALSIVRGYITCQIALYIIIG